MYLLANSKSGDYRKSVYVPPIPMLTGVHIPQWFVTLFVLKEILPSCLHRLWRNEAFGGGGGRSAASAASAVPMKGNECVCGTYRKEEEEEKLLPCHKNQERERAPVCVCGEEPYGKWRKGRSGGRKCGFSVGKGVLKQLASRDF